MVRKHLIMKKQTEEIYWLSYSYDLWADCIPMIHKSLPRIHRGEIVERKKNGVVIVKTLVNTRFIKNFEGVISGLKIIKKVTEDCSQAEMGIRERDSYKTLDEVKLNLIGFIMDDFEFKH